MNFNSSKSLPLQSATDSPTPRSDQAEPKRPCRVTVSEPGWNGAKMAAIAAGCSSVSEMIEKLGRGELSVIASDAVQFDPMTAGSKAAPALSSAAQHHIHIHPPAATAEPLPDEDVLIVPGATFPKLVLTGACAAMIVGSLLYIGDRILTLAANLFDPPENIEDIVTPRTGEVVAGYEVSDEYGIRPVHPVTGEANVMHNGVDLATPIGTPIYAVGKAGDRVTVECWWDVDGGGQVVDQVAESYPGYVFQSLHMSEKGCQSGEAKAGEVIAYSGNSGLGTGAHYDFRVKIDGEYVPPATKYLESAVTGEPPKE